MSATTGTSPLRRDTGRGLVGGVLAGVDIAPLEGPAEVGEVAEVLVVAGALAGQDGVESVVEVVAPGGVEAVAARLHRPHQPGVVEVALGDDEGPPPGAGLQGPDPPGDLLVRQLQAGQPISDEAAQA